MKVVSFKIWGEEKTKKGLKLCSPNPFARGWLTLGDQAANLALTWFTMLVKAAMS
jgi:hypothetical protein